MDEQTGFTHCVNVLLLQHCAAAERQHDAVPLGQLTDVGAFPIAEIGFTLFGKNIGDLFAFLRFEVLVSVDKVQPGQTGKLAANRRLAAAHEAT